MNDIKEAIIKTKNSFMGSIFVMLSIIILISVILTLTNNLNIDYFTTNNPLIDSFTGAITGSFFAGNPVTSFIISGELIQKNISLFFITAFILSWVTVGIVQLPAESYLLGKKFSIYRNLISFLSAIIISFIIVFLMGI